MDMHYGDKDQLENAILEVVVYKHEILGAPTKFRKNGLVSRKSIHYELCSIQKCELFPISTLSKILSDPYKCLVKNLNDIKNEEFILVKIKDVDGYGKFKVMSTEIVSNVVSDFFRLH